MPTNFSQKQIMIIGGAILAVLVIGAVVLLNIRSGGGGAAQLKITIWGTDSATAMNDLISKYSGPGSGTNSEVQYVQIDPSQYRSKILAALAAGIGPDVFEINNRDLPQWESVLAPVPASLETTFSPVTVENDFPDIVSQDFVSGGNVYALPLSIDTMAMIYNKDLFNTAGIATVPKTWEDFESDLPALRQVNAQGQITQAAAALGGSEASIADAPDIVFLLMMQNGAQMMSADGSSVTFATGNTSGVNAFNYYLQFANAANTDYTWNDTMGDSVDAFAQGKVAAIFDYSSALATIKAKSPFLNYGVSPMLQPANATIRIDYPNFNGFAVSRDSAQILGAWNFIINLTTSPTDENIYLTDTGAPPALRSVIAADMTDPVQSVFAAQALTAKSWYESDSVQIDSLMNTAIQSVLDGSADSTIALQQAQTAMNSIGD
jgi:ABC-type glycerol-3-phosphate transport system substrate-binding protein